MRAPTVTMLAAVATLLPFVVAGASAAERPALFRMSRKKVSVPTDLSLHFNESSKAATSLEALRLRRLFNNDHAAVSRHLQDAVAMYGPFRQLAYFYADIFIGSPSPQRFSVITDTGSSLTAVPCEQCGSQCGTHMNPRFQPLLSQTVRPVGCGAGCSGCSGAGQCQYQQGYAEGSSISGIVYADTAFLGDDIRNDAAARSAYTVSAFEFGCQLQEGGLFLTQRADGIMGIGQGHRSFIKTLWEQGKMRKNMFSVCMGLEGGAMTLGDVYSPLHKAPPMWASLTLTGFYVVFVEGATMDNGAVNIPTSGFNSPGTTILDSGTTFTYLPSTTYTAITSYIRSVCSQAGRCKGTPASVPGESYCYRLASPSDIASFPTLSWRLRGAPVADGGTGQAVTITMQPQHLFLNMGWDQGAYCLGVYSQGGSGAVLGANAMMGYDTILDLGQSRSDVANSGEPARSAPRVGFALSDCNVDAPVPQPSPSPSPAHDPSVSALPSPAGGGGSGGDPTQPQASISPSPSPIHASAGASVSPSKAVSPSRPPFSPSPSASRTASPTPPVASSLSPSPSKPHPLPSLSPSASNSVAAGSGGRAGDGSAATAPKGVDSATQAQALEEAKVTGRNAGIGISVGLLFAFAALCCVCACCRRRGVVMKCCGVRFALQKSSVASAASLYGDDETDTTSLGGTVRTNSTTIDTSAVVVPVMEAGNKAAKATATAANKVAKQVKAAVVSSSSSAASAVKKAGAGGRLPGAASRGGASVSSSAAATASVFDDDDDDDNLDLDLEDLENDLGVGAKTKSSAASGAGPALAAGASSSKREQRQNGTASNGQGSNNSGGYRKQMQQAKRVVLDDDDDENDDLGAGGKRNVDL